MTLNEKQELLVKLYDAELLHGEVYKRFSISESDEKMSSTLSKLSSLEGYHAGLWGKVLSLNKVAKPKTDQSAKRSLILFCKSLLGLALTVKIIEHTESNLHQRFGRIVRDEGLSTKESSLIKKVRHSEETEEERLEGSIVGHSRIFKNIRDVMFGMNDGLVELLAVAVGLAAALQASVLIFLAGFIVAISGTLSMAAGAYLSTGYQKDIDVKTRRIEGGASARSSAFYVGIFYFVGSLFPLSPFAFGLFGYTGIIIAIVLTSIVLTFTSSLIALASDKSVIRSIAKTLLISLGVAAITILLGAYIRNTFHITV
ncbi:MAG TPA: VIT1/CCC1 transporter family protein [Candidatus Acidoferrum sp.]|nr:VIT1/CCC1 transporter family protein [Candidatus Acidoferrum sp.]